MDTGPNEHKRSDAQLPYMRYRPQPMVDWFDVKFLAIIGVKAIVSSAFGNFADKREMQAVLTRSSDGHLHEAFQGKQVPVAEGVHYFDYSGRDELWVDFISDTGDGFDSTCTVASTAANQALQVEGRSEPLPRGDLLLLGGDQVYPTPEMDEYNARFRGPFSDAFAEGPYVDTFAIPGNHDWYDGLTNFVKLFCQQKKFGQLLTAQSRSYFALKITKNMWIWGIDNQLSGELDRPQKAYFQSIAKNAMAEDDQLVILTAAPVWVEQAEGSAEGYQTLSWFLWDYVLDGRKRVGKRFKLKAVLTGDLHHYSRYAADATSSAPQLITAGGGGAFTHLTHNLPDRVRDLSRTKLKVVGGRAATSQVGLGELDFRSPQDLISGDPQCSLKLAKRYPSQEESRALLRDNLYWGFKNFLPVSPPRLTIPVFLSTLLALNWFFIYAVGALARPGKACFLVLPLELAAFSLWCRWGSYKPTSIVHAVFQVGAALVSTYCLSLTAVSIAAKATSLASAIGQGLLSGSIILVLYSLVAGIFFGAYLYLANLFHRTHETDASSSLCSTRYKNFLKLHITPGRITIYPVGIDESPKWQGNTERNDVAREIKPATLVKARLIEAPIVLDLTQDEEQKESRECPVS